MSYTIILSASFLCVSIALNDVTRYRKERLRRSAEIRLWRTAAVI